MRQILLASVLFLVALPWAVAQETSETMMLHHTQKGERHSIKRGDFVKFSTTEGAEEKRYKGTFREVKDGRLFLKGKPGIAIGDIQHIMYRPKAMRWAFWGLLFAGYMLLGAAFFTTFTDPPLAGKIAIAGLSVIALSIVVSAASRHNIDNVNKEWTLEIPPPTKGSMQPVPLP
jgi:hypothetical protein